jgi:predicted PurR-regulated permease PerM
MLAALFLWAGFALLDLRYAALTAVVAAVLMMIPWLGNLFAVVAVLVLSSGKFVGMEQSWVAPHGWMAAALVAAVTAFLHFVIEPRLFNEDRYNSFWTVLITLALTFAFGVWGLLFGPAVGFGVQIALRHLHPLVFYESTRLRSLESITGEVAQLRGRYPREEAPMEVTSLLDRLEALITTHNVADLR